MDRKKLWDITKVVLKILFTVFALWIVYRNVDFGILKNIWSKANPWYFIPAIIAFVISQLISSFRVLQFFRNIQVPIPVWENIKLYLLGMFYSLFLPGGIGGDGYKIITLKKQYDTTHKDVFTAVFFDRLSGMWALCFLLIVCGFFLPEMKQYYTYIAAAFVAGTIVYYFIIKRFFPRMHKRFLVTHTLAFFVQSFQLVCVGFILLALRHNEQFLPYFAIFLLSSLASLFPFSIGGLGAREVVIMWGATTFGLNKDLSVSVSLCFYFISMMTALSAVFILFQNHSRKNQSSTVTE